MDFGYDKKPFDGTKEEWENLQNKIAWWVEPMSNYPFVVVNCPHCGSNNVHNVSDNFHKHRECNLHYYKGVRVFYECPGYKLGIYIG